MLYFASFLFRAIFIFCSACPFVAQANLFAECTFGDMQSSKSAQNMSFGGQLPSLRNMSHSCMVKTDNREGLLYLRAKRNNESKRGESGSFIFNVFFFNYYLFNLCLS